MWTVIQRHIRQATNSAFTVENHCSIGGGSINQAYRVSDGQQHYFVKLNQAHKLAMFEAEAQGLQALRQTDTLRVPQPLCWGATSDHSYLVLEWLNLGPGSAQSWSEMGQQLARLHRRVSDQGFGWHGQNTIGDTPQVNPWTEDWGQFFANHRIGYQVQLAQRRGGHFAQTTVLMERLSALLNRHSPQPALVHGDLWSGNAAFDREGQPVIFDPAVYYGDREVDLAMSELFGGFPRSFYQGYEREFPLVPGYEQRKICYNLYHILNHFNLFGGGYGSQAQQMITQILAMTV